MCHDIEFVLVELVQAGFQSVQTYVEYTTCSCAAHGSGVIFTERVQPLDQLFHTSIRFILYRHDDAPPMQMVQEHCWGNLTTTQVQEIAQRSKLDESGDYETALRDNLASSATTGANLKNASRDIGRNLPKTRFPKIKYHPIPIRHRTLGHGRPSLPFLYPHEVFSAIFHFYPAAFFTVIAPPGEVERFWSEVSSGLGLSLPLLL